MHAGKRYSLAEFVSWTRSDIIMMSVISSVPVILFVAFGWSWLAIPWVPVALVGTAAAFIVGFRNTQTYNRLWEARSIYGAIVNSSRTWGVMIRDLIGHTADDARLLRIKEQLVYRHIAWLTALRYQLREQRAWETSRTKKSNLRYGKNFRISEWVEDINLTLGKYLVQEELDYISTKSNRASQLVALQSKQLKQLRDEGLIEPLNYVELMKLISDFYDQQGRCERIKNFPYPRQFATISQMFTRLFASLVPFGVLNEFQKLGDWMVWLAIPFSAVVGWIFLTMERVGETTENPFEGGANDVPVTALSRTIEIDLLEMLDEKEIPAPLKPQNFILS